MSRILTKDIRSGINTLSGWVDRFVGDEPHLYAAKLFRISIFSWLLMSTLLLLPFHEQVWAPEAYMIRRPFNIARIYDIIFRIVLHPEVWPYYLWFVAALIVCLLLGILGIGLRVVTPLIFVLMLNVDACAPVMMDGGNNLSHLLLFYIIFMNTSGQRVEHPKYPILRMLSVAASNASVYMCRMQIIFMYTTAALLKVQGALWQKGMSLYYLLQSLTYSHPLAADFVTTFPTLAMFSTYFAVAFQLAFPLLVWFRAARPWILLAGVGLHIGIAFAMGLFTFGFIMIMVYPIFFYESWSKKWLHWLAPSLQLRVTVPSEDRRARVALWLMHYFDWFQLIRSESSESQDNANYSVKCWYAGRESEVYYGLNAWIELASRLPIFIPFMPFVRILQYLDLRNLISGFLSAIFRRPLRVEAFHRNAA